LPSGPLMRDARTIKFSTAFTESATRMESSHFHHLSSVSPSAAGSRVAMLGDADSVTRHGGAARFRQ
jgi:hypothetical protein